MDFGSVISTIALEEFDYEAKHTPPQKIAGASFPESTALRTALRQLCSPDVTDASAFIESLSLLGPTQKKSLAKWWRKEGDGLQATARKSAFIGTSLSSVGVSVRRILSPEGAKTKMCMLSLSLSDGSTRELYFSEEALDHFIQEL
eukprot:PhF_6_TR20361/c0_g1_i1/m.29344